MNAITLALPTRHQEFKNATSAMQIMHVVQILLAPTRVRASRAGLGLERIAPMLMSAIDHAVHRIPWTLQKQGYVTTAQPINLAWIRLVGSIVHVLPASVRFHLAWM